MKCDQCGSPLEEDWEYCPECGTTIDFAKVKKEQKSKESEIEADSSTEEDNRIEELRIEEAKVVRRITIAVLLMFGLFLGWLLGKTWLYVICFLAAIGVVVRGLVVNPNGQSTIFRVCLLAVLIIGLQMLALYMIAEWCHGECISCMTCGQERRR